MKKTMKKTILLLSSAVFLLAFDCPGKKKEKKDDDYDWITYVPTEAERKSCESKVRLDTTNIQDFSYPYTSNTFVVPASKSTTKLEIIPTSEKSNGNFTDTITHTHPNVTRNETLNIKKNSIYRFKLSNGIVATNWTETNLYSLYDKDCHYNGNIFWAIDYAVGMRLTEIYYDVK